MAEAPRPCIAHRDGLGDLGRQSHGVAGVGRAIFGAEPKSCRIIGAVAY